MPQLPPEQEAIAQRVVELLRAQPRSPDILTRGEAKSLARRYSEGAWVAWCRRWKVRPVSRGRYSRPQIELALAREAGLEHTPATLRRHQAGLANKEAA